MNNRIVLNKTRGFFVTAIISGIVVYLLFPEMIKSPNSYFYSVEGDGIQHYFSFLYHIHHDSSLTRTEAINYPYGELSMYAGNIPAISNPIKVLCTWFDGLSNHTVAIFNFSILISIIFSAAFLFLIFYELGISLFPAIIFSLGITFLSPQLARLGGHQSLAYMCAIPLLVYLLLRWHSKQKYILSAGIAFIAYFFSKIHVYYVAIFMFIVGFYWIFQLCYFANKKPTLSRIFHFTIQIMLPVIVLIAENAILDGIQDRPTKPYGFLIYRAYPQGVLLPIYEPYGFWLRDLINSKYVKWEGVAYVGFVSSTIFFIFMFKAMKQTIAKKFNLAIHLTRNSFVNIMFWIGFLGLLYSFGIPYILGLEFLGDYIGPLRQFRAIGRFAWIFYYVMNITAFYYIFHFLKKQRKRVYFMGIALVSAMLGYDTWLNMKSVSEKYQIPLPQLTEDVNADVYTSDNDFSHENYQAIIPLPFYQQGPENIGKASVCNSKRNSFITSLKTSLPLVAISAGRTSLHQGINNLQLVQEPYHTYEILNDLPNNKPFLLVVDTCKKLTKPELNLLHHAIYKHRSKCCLFYELPVDTLRSLPQKAFREKLTMLKNNEGALSSITRMGDAMFHTYDHLAEDISYRGTGSKSMAFRKKSIIFNDHLNENHKRFVVSFWYYPANKDLYPRMRLNVHVRDIQGKTYIKTEDPIFNHIKIFDGSWALVEFTLGLKNRNDRVTISLENRLIRKPDVSVDQFMVRPENQNVVKQKQNEIMINNRYYRTSETMITE